MICNEIKFLYESFSDDISKMIFRQRLMYSLTNNASYISDMILNLEGEDGYRNITLPYFSNLLMNLKKNKKQIILFGAGVCGEYLCNIMECSGLKADYFCDNDTKKWGKIFCNKKIISPAELQEKYKDSFIIIAIRDYKKEIYNQLMLMDIAKENIIDIPDLERMLFCTTIGTQYYEKDIVIPLENEVFADAGCFDVNTSREFIDWCNGKYDKIYAFEPDFNNFMICKDNIEKYGLKNINMYNSGLWSCTDTLKFNANGNVISSIDDSGSEIIHTVSLDEILSGEKVTFIKMDIEGAELEALKGAKNSIKQYHPRLAVCIYHKPEDILEIPLYIKSLVPEYKLYLRHYGMYNTETVLYAVI